MIKIGSLIKTETGYDKDIAFTYDGKEYRVILHWNTHEGFEATWLDDKGRFIYSPHWVDKDEDFYLKLDGCQAHTEVSL